MRVRHIVAAVALALGTATFGIAAQDVPSKPNAPSNPNILAAINSLRADVTSGINALFQQLQNIQVALQGLIPPATSNVRITPPILYGPDGGGLFCAAVNISTQPHTIRVESINVVTGQVLPSGVAEAVIQPNTLLNVGNSAGPLGYICRFTVVDGTRNDIRASGTQTVISGGNSTLTAIVPAE